MARKYTRIAVFFLVMISSLLLAGCAPKYSNSDQQTGGKPASAVLPEAESTIKNQAEVDAPAQLAAAASTAADQTTSFNIAGSVEKQSPVAWVVGGKTVLLSSSTQIQDNPGSDSQVDVSGSIRADGALMASQIAISDIEETSWSDPAGRGKFDIVGVVTSILTDTWVIGTQEVKVDENTQIESGLAVGSLVKAEGTILPDGTYLAHEISLVTHDERDARYQFQLVGTLETMEGTSWLISGITVTLDEQTRLGEGLAVGLTVKANGLVLDDGTLLARHIRLVRPGTPPEGTVRFTGLLTAMNENSWTVSDIAITITTTTKIRGNPQIGDMVMVVGTPQSDGSVLARLIVAKMHHPEPTPRPTEEGWYVFTGQLTTMNGDLWSVGGISVTITTTTIIKGDPQIGDYLKVQGILQADGSVLARKIMVERGQPQPTRTPRPTEEGWYVFTGQLTSMNDDVWSVGGISVTITTTTEIRGDPQIGDFLKVEGILQADGSVLARMIMVERGQPNPTRTPRPTEEGWYEFTGQLTAMNNDVWTVGEVSVIITTTTEIRGNPQIGDYLKVEGILQADGSVLAHEIMVERGQPHPTQTPGPHPDFEFTGVMSSISGNTWIVDGTTVIVTSDTEIRGDPQVGDTVKVDGQRQDDGSVLALKIKKESGDNGDPGHNPGGGGGGGGGGGDHHGGHGGHGR